MGGCLSADDERAPLIVESQSLLHTDSEEVEFTGPVKDRRRTDVKSLIFMSVFTVYLVATISYCSYYSDIYRIINGYDNCGNVCGRTNHHDIHPIFSNCSGQDMTTKPLLQLEEVSTSILNVTYTNRECVDHCAPDYVEFFGRCVTNRTNPDVPLPPTKGVYNYLLEISSDLSNCWRQILGLCVLAFVFSLVILLMLRFMPGVFAWLLLSGVMSLSIFGTICLWIRWKEQKDEISRRVSYNEMDDSSEPLASAITATIFTVGILLVLVAMRKRINLVVQLFKEASKAIQSMPLILFEPCLTFLAVSCIVTLWAIFDLLIESSGMLRIQEIGPPDYEQDSMMLVSRWWNVIGMLWFTQFMVGCQDMVIGGAVATWFFAKNKSHLTSPIIQSFSNLVRYHLGSVALGSMILTLVKVVRFIFQTLKSMFVNHQNIAARCMFRACEVCLAFADGFLQYLSRYAYIEVAMFGHSFCTAGKQAFKLMTSNALRIIVISCVGDFVLLMGKLLVVLATVLVGVQVFNNMENIQHSWVPLAIVGVFAFLIIQCFLTAFEMAIDTIFLCFCKDCEQNDGISRPYYMSTDLMEFVQNSHKAFNVQDDATSVNAKVFVSPSASMFHGQTGSQSNYGPIRS